MTTSAPVRRASRSTQHDHALVVPVAAAVLMASAFPQILWRELVSERGLWFVSLVQVATLICALAVVRRTPLAVLEPVLRWLVAMAVGWHLVIGTVTATSAWDEWQHSVPWAARAALFQLMLCVPTALLVLLGPGRAGRAALRLAAGDDSAPAGAGIYTAGQRPAWRALGPVWALLITVGTVTAMWFALGAEIGDLSVLLWSLPAVVVLAATNTVNEEFGFRNVPLAFLPVLVGSRGTLLLTGGLFGLAHYYGNPPGPSGVLLAGFLGVLLAKSMIETGGSKWAWTIHWLQDVIIFSFLALAWTDL